jgi:hypothetical protein
MQRVKPWGSSLNQIGLSAKVLVGSFILMDIATAFPLFFLYLGAGRKSWCLSLRQLVGGHSKNGKVMFARVHPLGAA